MSMKLAIRTTRRTKSGLFFLFVLVSAMVGIGISGNQKSAQLIRDITQTKTAHAEAAVGGGTGAGSTSGCATGACGTGTCGSGTGCGGCCA